MNKKRRKRKVIAIVTAFVLLCAALGFFVYQFKVLSDKNGALEEELNANTQNVYVATTEIKAGEKITQDNVAIQTIKSGLENWFYISSDQIGSTALVDISEGTPVYTIMVTDIEYAKDSRDYEISVANLMTNQIDYDTVDVRIMFPNGEDYVILPKKTITGLNLDGCVFTSVLNEEEILRMASATIDAYTTTGAYIYTTRYVANSQEEATPTYLVRAEALDLIATDPNVLTRATQTLNLSARLSLEARLTGLSEEELESVANGWSIADTAGSSTAKSSTSKDSYEEDTEKMTMKEIANKTEETMEEEN